MNDRPGYIPGTNAVDLSRMGQRTPNPNAPKVNPLGVPAQRNPNYNPYGADVELTPKERNEAVILWREIAKRYEYKELTESTVQQLVNECKHEFAEKLGLIVDLTWDGGVDVDADPNSDKIYFLPNLVIEARTEERPTDYDEIKHQVRAGEADGKPGVVREDGWHEDARRKQVKG